MSSSKAPFKKIHSRWYIFLILFFALFTSCVGPAKMNKWVADEYGETTTLTKSKNDYITVSSPLITIDDKSSKASKRTKRFLPLLFYWKMDYQLSAILNPKIPVNLFTSTFTTYANSKNIKQKLNGGKLELIINRVPVTFSFNDDENLYWFVLFYIHTVKLYTLPEKQELIVDYKLTKGTDIIKSGSVNIPDANKIQKTRFLESVKKATKEYLSQYDENIRAMARSAAEQIITQL